MNSINTMLRLGDSSFSSDPVEDTLRKLASHMDDSAGAYLLIESLTLLNDKIKVSTHGTQAVKLGGGFGGGLVDPFAIQTEAAP